MATPRTPLTDLSRNPGMPIRLARTTARMPRRPSLARASAIWSTRLVPVRPRRRDGRSLQPYPQTPPAPGC